MIILSESSSVLSEENKDKKVGGKKKKVTQTHDKSWSFSKSYWKL